MVEAGVGLVDQQPVVAGAPAGQREPAVTLVDQRGVVAAGLAALDVDVEDRLLAAVRGEGEAVAALALVVTQVEETLETAAGETAVPGDD